MAEKKRDWRDTKVLGIKRMKEEYERDNRTVCPSSKLREFELHMEKEVLPVIYSEDR